MSEDEVTTRAFCNICCGEKNHSRKPFHARNYAQGSGEHPRPIRESWDLLICLGCDSVRIRRTASSPEDMTPEVAEFPPREFRRIPAWQGDLPQEIGIMHREIYDALQAKASCCATMGMPPLIDMTLTQVVGDRGSFPATLAAAVQAGHLTPQDRNTLEAAIEAGSAAAHRGFTPNEQQIEDVLGIVEHLLQGFYVLGQVSDRLRNQIPPRTRQ